LNIRADTATVNFRIAVRVKSRIFLVDPATVEWVEAYGNYVRVHHGTGAHLVRGTISGFEQHLRAYGFVRVHRSALVNISHVVSLEPVVSGDYTIHLGSGRDITLSRTYRERFFAFVSVPMAGAPPSALAQAIEGP
jgi:two-component system LytT family response regulator